jgi:hypothetical protein
LKIFSISSMSKFGRFSSVFFTSVCPRAVDNVSEISLFLVSLT